MKNILEVSNAMFKNKEEWVNITNEEKSQFFFIFNRYFSKKYPDLSLKLNSKNCDKSSSMDLWFYFMKDKPYPRWFWSKSKAVKDKGNIDLEIFNEYGLNREELQSLIDNYPNDFQEELDWINQKNKNK